MTTGQRVRKIRAHGGIINSVDRTMAGGAGSELIVTGSDDGTVKVWECTDDDGVAKQFVANFDIGCPVTGVCWGKDGQNIYVASLDNEIHVRTRNSFSHSSSLLCPCIRSTTSATPPLLHITPFRGPHHFSHYPATPILLPPCLCPPTATTFFRPLSLPTFLSTISAPSHLVRREFIVPSEALQQDLRTRCSKEHGVEMKLLMEGSQDKELL